jgi:hypothetical protein
MDSIRNVTYAYFCDTMILFFLSDDAQTLSAVIGGSDKIVRGQISRKTLSSRVEADALRVFRSHQATAPPKR